MSSDQVDSKANATKRTPMEITDWDELIRYARFLNRDTDETIKICVIDEEQEEIRIENKEEFNINIQYARDHDLKSLKFLVYMNDVLKFDGIYQLEQPKEMTGNITVFPVDKLRTLRVNVLADKWRISVKRHEEFGVCLQSAIYIVEQGQLHTNDECQQFVETIAPEAFRKLQTSESVFSWSQEIHDGIFDMLELLVDLTGNRLRYPPVPISLLNALTISFDTNTAFSQKHKTEPLPKNRVYTLDDNEFLRIQLNSRSGSYGWLRSLLQRFVSQNGLRNLCSQFEHINNADSTVATMEYNCLLKVFSKCHHFINADRYRLIFSGPVRRAIHYLLETTRAQNQTTAQLNELKETLIEVCFNYEMTDEVNELLQVSSNSSETSLLPAPIVLPTISLETVSKAKTSKNKDCYERLAEEIRLLTMNSSETEQQSIKKQRTDEQISMPFLTRRQLLDCTDDSLSSSDKRSLKRKYRREQHRLLNNHCQKKDKQCSNILAVKTYDRTNPADVLRFFAPMKIEIAALHDDLQTATWDGDLREVLKIEEKLKLIRPYSARFVVDDNTPDGTKMQRGQVFRKVWILLNDGSMPWSSEDIKLINLADGIQVVHQPIIPVVAPHDRAFVSVDFMCADQPGHYESKWILSYRHRTFGPIIWCSIEVVPPTISKPIIELNETFELIDVPLPACFDLCKPYHSIIMKTSNDTSRHLSLSRSNSSGIHSESLIDIDTVQSAYSSDSDSHSISLTSTSPITTRRDQIPENDPTQLIQLSSNNSDEHRQRTISPRSNQPLHFVDAVVTNIFSVAKQAGSTAKAIFHTLQATEETRPSSPTRLERQRLTSQADDFFEHLDDIVALQPSSISSNEPMDILVEMGFVNRTTNQRLLTENQNDLNKVIEILTTETNDHEDSFVRRH